MMKTGKPGCRVATLWLMLASGLAALATGHATLAADLESGTNFVPLDLRKFFTAKLTDTINCPVSLRDNNLAALPLGRQNLAGTPFEIGGLIQLAGKTIRQWGRTEFPESVKNIPVYLHCQKIHLLHGTGGYDHDGYVIAKVILHYAGGSIKELPIFTGAQVRDWWGDPKQTMSDDNTVLAWSGTNPALLRIRSSPSTYLRLYKSTFDNPQPKLQIRSVDYVSLMLNSSPFLVALTFE